MLKKVKNQKGLSLMETIMAIAVFSIGIVGFTTLFSQVWKNNVYTYEMGSASLAASQGVSGAVNYLRKARQGDDGAYPVKSAADNDLVIFSDFDKDGITERLHFYRSGNDFIMGFRKPSAGLPKTYALGDEDSVVIASNIVNAADEPIFSYFNRDYPADTANNPLIAPASVWDVRLVEIFIRVNSGRGGFNGVELRSFVELRNLNDYSRLTS